MKTKLLILGAGCSLPVYPLAKDMRSHLAAFGGQITSTAPRLADLVHQTLKRFDDLEVNGSSAQTLDEFARLVHEGKLHGRSDPGQRLESLPIVEKAKLATAAMFLSHERTAARTGLDGYLKLLRRLFPKMNSGNYQRILAESPWRVMTFNYDRLFELAFRQFVEVDMTEAFYGPTRLNSGLRPMVPDEIEIDLQRFSLLKLHGSAGVYSSEWGGDCRHIHSSPDPKQPPSITDDEFFHDGKPRSSLIVFPHEIPHLEQYPGNKLPFRNYLPKILESALHFASYADEVWIVGYSLPDADWPELSKFLNSATSCQRIVVQNPSAKAICQRLQVRLPGLKAELVPYEATFEAG